MTTTTEELPITKMLEKRMINSQMYSEYKKLIPQVRTLKQEKYTQMREFVEQVKKEAKEEEQKRIVGILNNLLEANENDEQEGFSQDVESILQEAITNITN